MEWRETLPNTGHNPAWRHCWLNRQQTWDPVTGRPVTNDAFRQPLAHLARVWDPRKLPLLRHVCIQLCWIAPPSSYSSKLLGSPLPRATPRSLARGRASPFVTTRTVAGSRAIESGPRSHPNAGQDWGPREPRRRTRITFGTFLSGISGRADQAGCAEPCPRCAPSASSLQAPHGRSSTGSRYPWPHGDSARRPLGRARGNCEAWPDYNGRRARRSACGSRGHLPHAEGATRPSKSSVTPSATSLPATTPNG
jgi:hypothetical protein